MYVFQKHISIFFMLIFVGMQAMVLHSFEHGDEDTNCEVCVLMHHAQQQPYLLTDVTTVPTSPVNHQTAKVVTVYAFAKADSTPDYYSVRPPPVFTY